MIELVDVTCAYDRAPVVQEVSLAVTGGELVAIVGPNGAGKTSLLRVAGGLLKPSAGHARIAGRDPAATRRRDLARDLAYLPQRYELAFPFTALEVALMGRYAHQRGPGLERAVDLAAAREGLERVDAGALADRRFDTLSGGERRRVLLAQALCQGARAIILDEPTAALDPAHAIAVMSALAVERGRGAAILLVTHDLDLAARHADRVLVLSGGRTLALGPPLDVFARAEVAAGFGATLHVGALPDGGRFVVAR
ncbi:MAG TPA: ABC transporter ATP-binding protein [Kofleriaceae bacterium]|nr:ABC transporter ATP-binding protein [Kofleriaceae bacterium]